MTYYKYFIPLALLCCSVTQLCLTLCNTPGFPVLHHLLEFAQTRVHWISDAIQSSHPLLSPSPPAFNLIQHQGGQNIGALASASVLPVDIQGWFPLGWTDSFFLLSKGQQEASPTPQFESINSSVLSLLSGPTLNICTWLLEKTHSFD